MKNYSGELTRREKGKSQAKHGDVKTVEAQIADDFYRDPVGMLNYFYKKGEKRAKAKFEQIEKMLSMPMKKPKRAKRKTKTKAKK